MQKGILYQRLHSAFTPERVICRLIAAWACFAMLILLGGQFSDLSYAQDTSLLTVALSVAGMFLLLSVVAFWLRGFQTDSWFLLLFSGICVFDWLATYNVSKQSVFFRFAVAAVFCLFVLYAVHANKELLQKWQPGKRTIVIVTVVAGLLSCTVIAVITCLRYVTFASPNFDFGLFCNMFHNMAKSGMPLVTSERDQLLSHFAVHISPVYYLFLPFYWLFSSPLTLQIGQAVVLAAGIIPVILLARHFKLSGKLTVAVAFLYAFYPALTSGCFYDLHENCFLPLCLLCTFLFYEKRRWIPMYISAVLVLSVKEDAAIYLLFFALFILLSEQHNWRHGLSLLVLSIGYFILCGYLLETYGTGMMINRFNNLIYDSDDGLLGAVKTALVNPGYLLTQLFATTDATWGKISYLLQLLLPLGLLPFCTKKPSRWMLTAPLLINLLTTYVYQYNLDFQYHFGITAFLFYALLKNLPELHAPTRNTLISIGAAVCCCFYIATAVPKLNNYVTRWNNGHETYAKMEALLDTIPEDASVACSTFLLAHIADRSEIYELYYHGYRDDVDYIAVDLRYSDGKDYINAYKIQDYEIVAEEEGLIAILKRPKTESEITTVAH